MNLHLVRTILRHPRRWREILAQEEAVDDIASMVLTLGALFTLVRTPGTAKLIWETGSSFSEALREALPPEEL